LIIGFRMCFFLQSRFQNSEVPGSWFSRDQSTLSSSYRTHEHDLFRVESAFFGLGMPVSLFRNKLLIKKSFENFFKWKIPEGDLCPHFLSKDFLFEKLVYYISYDAVLYTDFEYAIILLYLVALDELYNTVCHYW
jgi:hypothetical protein